MQFFLPLVNGTAIQLHYWFNDNTHNMDAFLQNKCELELLNIFKAIAESLGEDIAIETEPIGEGGLRRWFKLIGKSENKSPIVTTAIITALFTSVVITPIGTSITKIVEKVIDKAFEDDEEKQLNQEKIKAEIENIKTDTELKKQQLQKNHIVVKRRSNFYENLSKYPKITNISFVIQDENKNNLSKEISISKHEFEEFILISDELEPLELNNAIIEIVSPVLKKGNYKWKGIYNGEIISFNMKSNEFKALVQNGTVEFKNGTTIKCFLEIKRKINNEGIEEYTEYNIIRVNEYFDTVKPIETNEGKKYRRSQEAQQNQINLFDNTEND
jgi:hypothetical protein